MSTQIWVLWYILTQPKNAAPLSGQLALFNNGQDEALTNNQVWQVIVCLMEYNTLLRWTDNASRDEEWKPASDRIVGVTRQDLDFWDMCRDA